MLHISNYNAWEISICCINFIELWTESRLTNNCIEGIIYITILLGKFVRCKWNMNIMQSPCSLCWDLNDGFNYHIYYCTNHFNNIFVNSVMFPLFDFYAILVPIYHVLSIFDRVGWTRLAYTVSHRSSWQVHRPIIVDHCREPTVSVQVTSCSHNH